MTCVVLDGKKSPKEHNVFYTEIPSSCNASGLKDNVLGRFNENNRLHFVSRQ